MDYQGVNNTLRVIFNKSGRVTFKIPADGDKTALVSVSREQAEQMRDQLTEHLEGDATDKATRVIVARKLKVVKEALGDLNADVADAVEEHLANAIDVLDVG